MNSRGSRGGDNLISALAALAALAAVLAKSKGVRRQVRRAPVRATRGAGAPVMAWVIIGFVMLMVLLPLLSGIVQSLVGSAGFGLAFCLIPGLLLTFAGLMARRAREAQRSQGSQVESQPAAQSSQTQGSLTASPTAQTARPAAPSKVARKPAPAPVKNPADYRTRAVGYRRRIQSLIKSRRRGPLSDLMNSIVPKLEGWEERVGQLADRLANFENDRLIQRDIKEVSVQHRAHAGRVGGRDRSRARANRSSARWAATRNNKRSWTRCPS